MLQHLRRELSFSITLMPRWRQKVLRIIYIFVPSTAYIDRLTGHIVSNHKFSDIHISLHNGCWYRFPLSDSCET